LLFPIVFAFLVLHRRPNYLPTAAVLAISLLPFDFAHPRFGRTGFVVVYALFAMGCLSAQYGDQLRENLKRIRGPALLLSAFIVFVLYGIGARNLPAEMQFYLVKYYKFLYILAIPVMVILSGQRGTITNFVLSNPYISHLGRPTYGICLWQQLFTGPAFVAASASTQFGAVAGMILFCVIMYEVLELRIIRFGHRISGRIKDSASAANRVPVGPVWRY
jgi:hypothetical protein